MKVYTKKQGTLWPSPGARANMARDSPVDATAVTRDRRRLKYWDRMDTVGRKVRL